MNTIKVQGQFAKRKAQTGPEDYAAWKKNPSEENLGKVLQSLDRIIKSSINAHAGGDMSYLTRARLLAVNAIKSYDPQSAASLNTHVFNNLRRLNRIRASRQNAVHIPENMHQDRYKIQDFIKNYEDRNGFEPSNQTISDSLSMSSKRVNKALSGEMPSSKGLSEKGDVLSASGREASDIWIDYVYFDLDEKDKKIFEWTTGYNGAETMSKKSIASKLGISQPAVSQRVNRIASKLEEIRA